MIEWIHLLNQNIYMTNNLLHMTNEELNITNVMDRLKRKELDIKEASKLIGMSERHTKRLKKKYISFWVEWLIHKARWRPSNHKWDDTKYIHAIQIIKDNYSDYWPTLSSEKLAEKYNIYFPISTLRLQMIRAWIWAWKTRKQKDKQFTARERKENYWEMVQYDWSYHFWFEWRNSTEYQCLLVWVDDATWELTAKFALNEWLIETFKFWKEYIEIKWKPLVIYLDKFATYKVNYPTATDDKELTTQFGRVCKNLWVKLIFANTPQAKWRVEKMNGTLQNRLVKALREENISDMETANKYLQETFLPAFNKKFMVEPKWDKNLHMKLNEKEVDSIDQIFSEHKERKIANDYTIKFENKFYQLYRKINSWYMIKSWDKVTIEKWLDWKIRISKKWIYIESKTSFLRPEKILRLFTAPLIDDDIEEMRKEILEKREAEKLERQKQIEENKKNKKTYYERTWKSSPFVKWLFIKKNKSSYTKGGNIQISKEAVTKIETIPKRELILTT